MDLSNNESSRLDSILRIEGEKILLLLSNSAAKKSKDQSKGEFQIIPRINGT